MRTKEVQNILEEGLMGDCSEEVVNRTWAALRYSADKSLFELTPLLEKFLYHPENDLRLQALCSLVVLENRDAINQAIYIVLDPLVDPSDRALCLECLLGAKIDPASKTKLLEACLQEDTPIILRQVALVKKEKTTPIDP